MIEALARWAGWIADDLAEGLDTARRLAPEVQRESFAALARAEGIDPGRLERSDEEEARPACDGCAYIAMHATPGPDGRRRFRWGCTAGHRPLELAHGSERVLVAPLACRQFTRFRQPGSGESASAVRASVTRT